MKKILIAVDLQNDFVSGALGTAEAEAIVPRAAEKIRRHEGPVLVTMDTHGEDYLSTAEGKKLPVVHCIAGTDGWQIQKDLDEYAREHHSLIFDKETFGSPNLAGCLSGIARNVPIDEVELIGVCTDICVISNALLLKAAVPETRIIVDASCCAGVTPESHMTALKAMQACQIDIEGAQL